MQNRLSQDKVPRRVHAVGAYGFGNFGDELFVETIKENAAALWPRAEVRTFAPKSNFSAYSRVDAVGQIIRVASAVAGFLWADCIAMCGGSILQDIGGVPSLRAKVLRYRISEALGVSVGPFVKVGASERVNSYLKTLDRLVVRDEASQVRLASMPDAPPNTRVGGDLAALSSAVRASSSRSKVVTICPSAASNTAPGELLSQIGKALSSMRDLRGRVEVRLLALSVGDTSDDRALCKDLKSGLTEQGVPVSVHSFGELGVEGTCAMIAESGAVWSQRLHGAVVAYLSGVPFLLEGHHAKCIDFAEDIGAGGQIIENGGQWAEAATALSSGILKPSMTVESYRERARKAYLGSAW